MTDAANRAFSPLHARLYVLLVAVLAVSGLAQMPIFKRYYIADLPGLGWLADYYVTHKLHYVAAALLLALLGYLAARWVREWSARMRPTVSGMVRALLLAGIVLTGAVRMYKNQPGVSFEPLVVMLVDWTHLGLVLLLGLAAVLFRITGTNAWATARGR